MYTDGVFVFDHIHMLLLGLGVPALAAGFLKAFRLAFLLLPCLQGYRLQGIVSFYGARLQGYVAGARRGVQLLQARSQLAQQQQEEDGGAPSSSSSAAGAARMMMRDDADVVAHAMLAFDDIY